MPNLREIRQKGPVPKVGDLLERLLIVLAQRHAEGRVHGSLCPEAIRLTGKEIRLVPAAEDPDYAAPELREGHGAAMAQDVYAVGAVAWFLLTGGDPGSAPPRDLHGYGWLDGLVSELTAPLDRRPLNASEALKRLRAARPESTGSSSGALLLVVVGVLLVAGLVGLAGTAAVLLWDEDSTEPKEQLQAQGPDSVRCNDTKAEGPLLEAAQAWKTCRFVTAHALYEANSQARPAVLACREERLAAAGPHLATLKRVESDLDIGACHWARGKLESTSFEAGPECLAWLESCEAKELPLRQAEVARSEAKLNAQLKSPFVTEVRFRQVPDDQWVWDIVVEGGWLAFFAQLEGLLASQGNDNLTAATAMIGYLTAICDAVGTESQNTLWSSRYLVFEDHGQCTHRLPTADAREVSRRLKSAQASGDQEELVSAVEYLFSRLQDC